MGSIKIPQEEVAVANELYAMEDVVVLKIPGLQQRHDGAFELKATPIRVDYEVIAIDLRKQKVPEHIVEMAIGAMDDVIRIQTIANVIAARATIDRVLHRLDVQE